MTHRLIKVAEANRRLENLVTGDQLVGFETGDVWILKLQDENRVVAFQRMSSTKEPAIKQALKAADEELFDCADSEEISWATVLTSVMRKTIVGAVVDDEATLTLTFKDGVEIALETDADIVDWQWCVTKNEPNPYIARAELACFWRSELSVWDIA